VLRRGIIARVCFRWAALAEGETMKNRIKDLYLEIGRVLNNPEIFGLGERMPKQLADTLTRIQSELMEELREEGLEQSLLAQELSQGADGDAFPELTSTSFELPKTGS
jgi:hypothetical protein